MIGVANNAEAETWRAAIETSAGLFIATFTRAGLRTLDFPRNDQKFSASQNLPGEIAAMAHTTSEAVAAAVNGVTVQSMPPLDWTGHTEFRQRVWAALCAIPAGHTRTYSEIAGEIGAAKAVRAVGSACGANPIPVLVPCHRVLASGGGLGGFSGGLDWKRKLLSAEGVLFGW